MRDIQPPELIGHAIKRSSDWRCGIYEIDGPNAAKLFISASNGYGWEHVSVSLRSHRCPNWPEMCFVKNLFWDEDETVIQYHPSKDQYVDFHPTCLHMWKPENFPIETPPRWMIGPYPGYEKDLPKELRGR